MGSIDISMTDIENDAYCWYAAKTGRPFKVAERLEERGIETYLPIETVRRSDGTTLRKPLIPKLLFLRTSPASAQEIENESRAEAADLPPLWIYRYLRGGEIHPIREEEMRLFRLLTIDDTLRCEIYHKDEFKIGDLLRVTGGPFAGYQGYARRIRKNKHIVVEIEGLCAIALPFIHPDLLEKV
ncbi:MAG: hypothetical protein K2K97_02030 [Muribaculaceae bacterium]|nr:hypothetical protein [Muribaculaceae bacterium]